MGRHGEPAEMTHELAKALAYSNAYKLVKTHEPLSLRDYPRPETYQRMEPKISRNKPCPCGSSIKFKKCCLARTR